MPFKKKNDGCLGEGLTKGSRQQKSIPTKPRSRSVPDVVDTKFAAPCGTAH